MNLDLERATFYVMIAARIKMERAEFAYIRSDPACEERRTKRNAWFAAKMQYEASQLRLGQIMKENRHGAKA